MTKTTYSLKISDTLAESELNKNVWLVVLHASRVPPHIGIIIGGNYNSLTIKGHELNVDISVLKKTIQLKKIETLFIQLQQQPVFSLDYQKEVFQHFIKSYTQVKSNESSCLSPVKLFLQEFYALQENKTELLFELIERIQQNGYIVKTIGLNISDDKKNDKVFVLPTYTYNQLQTVIELEQININKF